MNLKKLEGKMWRVPGNWYFECWVFVGWYSCI